MSGKNDTSITLPEPDFSLVCSHLFNVYTIQSQVLDIGLRDIVVNSTTRMGLFSLSSCSKYFVNVKFIKILINIIFIRFDNGKCGCCRYKSIRSS